MALRQLYFVEITISESLHNTIRDVSRTILFLPDINSIYSSRIFKSLKLTIPKQQNSFVLNYMLGKWVDGSKYKGINVDQVKLDYEVKGDGPYIILDILIKIYIYFI